tara:strand:+ start:179 stop:433 length:255 start_codon:yes stop_codon:yes gene_type:complete
MFRNFIDRVTGFVLFLRDGLLCLALRGPVFLGLDESIGVPISASVLNESASSESVVVAKMSNELDVFIDDKKNVESVKLGIPHL